MNENDVAKQIVDVAFNLHKTYGPGLLESVYEAIAPYELRKRGLVKPPRQSGSRKGAKTQVNAKKN